MKTRFIFSTLVVLLFIGSLNGTAVQVREDSWAKTDIDELTNKQVFSAPFESSSKETDEITTAEFTAILVRAILNGNVPEAENASLDLYADVKAGHKFYKEIAYAKSQGFIIIDNSDNKINPDGKISREKMIRVLSKINLTEGNSPKTFGDISVSYQYIDELNKLAKSDIIFGYPDGTLMPSKNATLGEAAAAVNRIQKSTNSLNKRRSFVLK